MSVLLQILVLTGVTLIPALELRASIPWGMWGKGMDMHWSTVFVICVLANAVVTPVTYVILDKFNPLFMKIKFYAKFYNSYILKTQAKLKPYIDKYGDIGLAVFIGVPLPGTGAYSGAIGGYFLGMKLKNVTMAGFLGVLIAGVAVLAVCLIIQATGTHVLDFFIQRPTPAH